ncbi:DUF2501 domain-containing protein [Noviherbaspirillum suwonense]|uniref:DUF2501 domain-containing protein n=1 Tax=Noviherbaspirillum suwonense TaxID=1224511 RepID=A0ABY1QL75_9BURK|nr:DUF2501 domain-containing protein [Noviherbaspirillum suwonense]SMP74679.1 Protein of unknown function [Noviherbaspirillum suwonense]
MKATLPRLVAASLLAAALFPAASAHAQLGDLLDKAKGAGASSGSGASGALGGLGGALSGQSMTAGSTGNVAGILEFCIRNNYLNGNAASGVKDALMGKLPGGSAKSDSGYGDGAKGILNSASGNKLDLGGGGLKAQVTKQVCDTVLSQAKSLL